MNFAFIAGTINNRGIIFKLDLREETENRQLVNIYQLEENLRTKVWFPCISGSRIFFVG